MGLARSSAPIGKGRRAQGLLIHLKAPGPVRGYEAPMSSKTPMADPRRDDLAPVGEEARAQRSETIMPLIWAGLGLIVVLVFAISSTVR